MRQYVWVVTKVLGSAGSGLVGVYSRWEDCHAELVRHGQGSVVGTGPDREPVAGYLWLPALPSEPGMHVQVWREAVR